MKKITNIILLSAGILLSLTGCQKGNDVENAGRLVRFSASTGAETRTAYSGEITNNFERIDWVSGDKIMIWSDNATVRPDGTPKFPGNQNLAVYTIGTKITASNQKSIANIEDPEGNGLQFPNDDSPCQFWAVYPSSAVTASPVKDDDDNFTLPFKIESDQSLAENTNTTLRDYTPNMEQAVMLGYVSGATSKATVDLPFKPAFTDFEFNLKIGDGAPALTVTAMEITSSSSALAGNFTATCNNGTWSYVVADNAVKSVKAVLPGNGVTLDAENPLLSINAFAVPQQMTDLKVTFYTNEGKKTVKMLKSDKTTPMTFEGGKKHRINGLILPSGWYFDYLTLDLEVLSWEAVSVEGDSDEFPQAAQFSISGDGVLNGYKDIHNSTGDKDPWRQSWYFKDGQTLIVYFKVMLPAGGTWEVELMGGTEAAPNATDAALFTVKNVSPDIDDETPTVEGNLYGPMKDEGSTEVKLEITYNGTAGEAHSCYLHSYVYSGADKSGTKYNIDSETQLYDGGRGYHTFYVNSTLYPNN